MDQNSVSRPSIDKVRGAWVEYYKKMVLKLAADRVAGTLCRATYQWRLPMVVFLRWISTWSPGRISLAPAGRISLAPAGWLPGPDPRGAPLLTGASRSQQNAALCTGAQIQCSAVQCSGAQIQPESGS